MNDKNIIKDGSTVNGNLICYFKNGANSKKYCYYVLGDQTGGSPTVKVHVAVVKQNNETLDTPIADDEWATLKGIMGNVVQGKASENITYLIPNADLEVVNEKVIAMPVSYDYVNKHKAEYDASKVADDAPADTAPAGDTVAPASEIAPAPEATTLTPDVTAPATPEAPASAESKPTNLFDQALNPADGAADPVAPVTNMFDQSPAPAAPVTPEVPVTDINGFSNMVPEQDKEIPKVPDATPVAPETQPENTFNNIIPNPSDISNEPIVDSNAQAPAPQGAAANLNIDEIKNKCTEMINALNAFSEELSKIAGSLGSSDNSITAAPISEPVISSVEPVAVSPTPIQNADVAATTITPPDAQAQAGSFETNWFDTTN